LAIKPAKDFSISKIGTLVQGPKGWGNILDKRLQNCTNKKGFFRQSCFLQKQYCILSAVVYVDHVLLARLWLPNSARSAATVAGMFIAEKSTKLFLEFPYLELPDAGVAIILWLVLGPLADPKIT
jgi:hypothetical protein